MMLDELTKRARTDISSLINKTQITNTKNSKNNLNIQKTTPITPIRLIITLLIQQPSLFSQIKLPIPTLNIPGSELLQKLLAILQNQPDQNTGQLLEHWRDTPNAATFAKLAQLKLTIPTDGIDAEFVGAISRLRKQAHEQNIAQLLAKAANSELSNDDKNSLAKLIAALHAEPIETN